MSEEPDKFVKSDLADNRAPWSCIIGSPIEEYIINSKSSQPYDQAIDVFARECQEALYVAPIDTEYFCKRFEVGRPFIVKILLYFGLVPNSEAFNVMARLIDCIVSEPSLTLTECIRKTADKIGLSVSAVSRMIEKTFYVYDNGLYDRITYLTRTKPLTAKDALYDIATYVGTKSLTIASEK